MQPLKLILAGILLSLCHVAWAVDGAREINSACVTFGCFSGDSSSFPVTITEAGNYVLTSNLTTTNVNQTMIQVDVNNVSIDLNGFSISGPVSCSGSAPTCTDSGTGTGIDAAFRENIIVHNGIVTGMGNHGVVVGGGSLVEDMVVAENAADGVTAAASGSVLRFLSVRENGGTGVLLGFAASYLMDSTVLNNAGLGGVFGGFCGNVLMVGNDAGNSCTAIAPSRCGTPADCD